jgi:NADH dehydrogenase FAD-containing subunit
MGRRSWVVKATKEKYEQVLEIQKDYELFIVGAGLVDKPLRFLNHRKIFVEGDIVLLLQSDGEYVLRRYPKVFQHGYCLLDNIHSVPSESGNKIEEIKYLKEEELLELLDQFPTGHIYI